MSTKLFFALILLTASACSTPRFDNPLLNATLTPPPSQTPLQFESLGNAIGITAFVRENKIEAGQTIAVNLLLEPLTIRASRKSDGSIAAISTSPWSTPNVTGMQICTALDNLCELNGKWIPFSRTQEIRIDADWIGERSFWVRAQFRDASGAIVPAFSSATFAVPQDSAQYTLHLAAALNELTPMAVMPAKIQTLVAETRTAFPVTGFVKIENGQPVIGGKAGSTRDVKVQFGASSPQGEVKEMRVKDFGTRKCATDAELSEAAWEPLVAEKIYKVGIALNFTSFDVSAQYRDTNGNLSPIYCADIAVEGSP